MAVNPLEPSGRSESRVACPNSGLAGSGLEFVSCQMSHDTEGTQREKKGKKRRKLSSRVPDVVFMTEFAFQCVPTPRGGRL